MESVLGAIQFFANSTNSVRVFEALTEGPTTSRDLAEQTGASRSTIARILDEGESRGWIDSQGSQYELTDRGRIMIDEFRALMDTIGGVQHLGDAIEWLPPPARSIDFRHFRDADITRPTAENPAAPFDRGIELLRDAAYYRGLTATATPRYVEILRDRLEQGSSDVEGVIEADFIETIRTEPNRAPPWCDFAQQRATWVYDGRVPINLHIVDETVLVWLGERREDELEVYGLLESESSAVVSWAESLYEDYLAEAEPLEPWMLAAE